MTLPPTKLSERAYSGAKAVEALEQDLDEALALLSSIEFMCGEVMASKIAKLIANRNERNGLE